VQVELPGAPEQVSATEPLKPLFGMTCKSYVAVLPAEIVAEVEQFPPEGQFAPLAAASAKSVPVPVRDTD
jgi:hypothetical protein